jgi:hypothetical protein
MREPLPAAGIRAKYCRAEERREVMMKKGMRSALFCQEAKAPAARCPTGGGAWFIIASTIFTVKSETSQDIPLCAA